ncbi:MAG: hypothetical protein K0Q79_3205 [Flavipsychrobacter sp.]|jgi:hypothetical protein|nr:hypothetical protein [Flavipsychrobacter sp.]
MKVYKAVFSENKIDSCIYACKSASNYSSYYYDCENGKLTFAIIKAKSPTSAYVTAQRIVTEVLYKSLEGISV